MYCTHISTPSNTNVQQFLAELTDFLYLVTSAVAKACPAKSALLVILILIFFIATQNFM